MIRFGEMKESILLAPIRSAMSATYSTTSIGVSMLIGVITCILLWIRWKQQQTRQKLEGCNLPTVFWRPRFINYMPAEDEQDVDTEENHALPPKKKKMASSAITGILPRMERLGGPFGMYGTVYGVDTAVVHVAHPVPARAILSSTGKSSNIHNVTQRGQSSSSSSPHKRLPRRSTKISESSGASKAPAYNHFKNFSGDGVFTADGHEWKEKRASVIHCLLKGCTNPNSPGAQRLEREANFAADSFLTNIAHEYKNKNTLAATTPINIVPILQQATIGLIYRFITHDHVPLQPERQRLISSMKHNNICESEDERSTGSSSSSTSVSSLDDDSNHVPLPKRKEMDKKSNTSHASIPKEHFAPPNLLRSYLQSVTHIRMIILAQSRSIWFLLPRWVYRTFSSMYQEEERTMGPIRDFAERACVRAQPGSPLHMLRERPSHATSSTKGSAPIKKNGDGIHSDGVVSKALLDEAITLLFAGQDTSAATLSWTLHLLSIYPAVQTRLAEEVASVLEHEDVTKDIFITKKVVSKMTFLDAVVKEAMRLYPVAPFVVRKLAYDLPVVDEDCHEKTSATVLPEGALACVWIYGLHRNKELWDRPNDFVPDRWIDPDLSKRDAGQNMNGAYIPFAAGPRNCVGQPLAQVILRIVLARIIHQYRFTDQRLDKDGQNPNNLRKDMQAGFTVLPSGGVRLRVKSRYSK